MMQRDELLVWRTVLDNVLLGPEVVAGRVTERDRARARDLLAIAGLAGFENHYPGALSGGMRQRAAFVRTLMLDRPVVLLDEPFGALDAITRAEMQEWLLRMRDELALTLLLVTHDVDEAIFLSDRIAVFDLNPGRIVDILDVNLPHPRWEINVPAQPEAIRLRQAIIERLELRKQVLI
jgi:ABC-type nitrate/sulfonate/bicarbonate transport system ATPase subunit